MSREPLTSDPNPGGIELAKLTRRVKYRVNRRHRIHFEAIELLRYNEFIERKKSCVYGGGAVTCLTQNSRI